MELLKNKKFGSRIQVIFFKIVRWFEPRGFRNRDHDFLRRVRMLISFALALIFVSLMYAVIYFIFKSTAVAVFLVGGAGFGVCILFFFRQTGALLSSGNLLSLLVFCNLSFIISHQGGHGSVTLPWYATVPTMTFFLIREKRYVVFWFIVSILAVFVFYSFDILGYSFPDDLTPAQYGFSYFMSMVGIILIHSIFSERFNSENDQMLNRIKEAEMKFKSIYESSIDAIMLLTPEEGFISGNFATVNMFGCKDESEFVSKSPTELSPEYQPDGELSAIKAQAMMKKAMDEDSNVFEWTHTKIGGEKFLATVSLSRIKFNEREILQATVQDITVRKKAEEELKRRHNNTKEILEKSPFGVVVIDKKKKIRWVNEYVLKVSGVEKEKDILGRECTLYFCSVAPDLCPLINKDQKMVNSEVMLRGFDGKEIPVIKTVTEIFWENEFVFLETFIDISEHKKVEDALFKSEERLSQLVETMSDWVWEVDEQGLYTYCSENVIDILGYPAEEMIGTSPFDYISDDDKTRISELFSAAISKKVSVVDLKNENITKDGRTITLLTNAIPILDKEGKLKGYRGTDKDITDRSKAEDELKQKTAEIQRRNELMMGREERIIELKKEVNNLLSEMGKDKKYEQGV